MNNFLNDFKFIIGAVVVFAIILGIPYLFATYFKCDWCWCLLLLSFPLGTSIARNFLKD